MPLAVNACKIAWNKFIAYCDKHKDEKSQEGCDRYKADPKHFLVERVLRATINPIDAGYEYALTISHTVVEMVTQCVLFYRHRRVHVHAQIHNTRRTSAACFPTQQQIISMVALMYSLYAYVTSSLSCCCKTSLSSALVLVCFDSRCLAAEPCAVQVYHNAWKKRDMDEMC